MIKDKKSTPTKPNASKIPIVIPHLCPYEKLHATKTSEQMDVDPLNSIKIHNTKMTTTDAGKRNAAQEHPLTMCLDVNSLPNFKKPKHIKAPIKDPLQSYLHLAIDQ